METLVYSTTVMSADQTGSPASSPSAYAAVDQRAKAASTIASKATLMPHGIRAPVVGPGQDSLLKAEPVRSMRLIDAICY